jgi:glucose uptake protein GlcU
VDSSNSLLYRRSAALCLVVGLVAIVVGIVFYAGSHPNRGLAGILVGVILVGIGVTLAVVERRSRRGRPW